MKVEIELLLERDDLYSKCYKAWEHAESGIYEAGSNYWMTMFVDQLQAELRNNIRVVNEQVVVEVTDDL